MLWLSCLPAVLVPRWPASLSAYHAWGFPVEYQRGDQILTRVFWHNIFSGLHFSRSSPSVIACGWTTSASFARRGNIWRRTAKDEWVICGNENPDFNPIRWTLYDQVVRQMLFDRCRQYPGQCLAGSCYDKRAFAPRRPRMGLRHSCPSADLEIFTSPDVGDVVQAHSLEASQGHG